MVNLLGRIGGGFHTVCSNSFDAGLQVGKGVWAVMKKPDRALYDVYSMAGFEKTGKAAISSMKFYTLMVPSSKGAFKDCVKTLDAQKELIYATKVFESFSNFIDKSADGKSYGLKLPKVQGANGKDTKSIDFTVLWYSIGDSLDTLYFLKKYKVFSFSTATDFGARMGNRTFSTRFGETPKLNSIPVINTIFNRPKDIFIFMASCLEVKKCWNTENFSKLTSVKKADIALKLIGGVGKIILISSSEYLMKTGWGVIAQATVDLVTQNSGLIAYLIKQDVGRKERFKNPLKG